MQYRRLGSSGLQLSALSFGAWLTFGAQIGRSTARDLVGDCRRHEHGPRCHCVRDMCKP